MIGASDFCSNIRGARSSSGQSIGLLSRCGCAKSCSYVPQGGFAGTQFPALAHGGGHRGWAQSTSRPTGFEPVAKPKNQRLSADPGWGVTRCYEPPRIVLELDLLELHRRSEK